MPTGALGAGRTGCRRPRAVPRNAWQAVSERPLGFLASSWPWRSVAYLASGVALGAATAASLVGLAVAGALLALVVIGLVAFLAIALTGVAVGRFERWRLRLVDRDAVPGPHRRPDRRGFLPWLRTRLREPATWRELGYTVVSLGALWWIDAGMLALVLGIPGGLIARRVHRGRRTPGRSRRCCSSPPGSACCRSPRTRSRSGPAPGPRWPGRSSRRATPSSARGWSR